MTKMAEAIEYATQFLRGIAKTTPAASRDHDIEAFIMNELNPAIVAARAIEGQLESAEEALLVANDILRSCFAVAERMAVIHGTVVAGTNWGALHEQIGKALDRQLEILKPRLEERAKAAAADHKPRPERPGDLPVPTPSRKSSAFEWLRAQALDEKNPNWLDAALLLEELARGAAIGDVIAERNRQIRVEGWTHGHDDFHDAGELASAGAAYALHAGCVLYPHDGVGFVDAPPECWLWDTKWWKPKDPRRDLVRAAALIVAEIERLDREAQPKPKEAT